MDKPITLTDIEDITVLKSYAFDCIQAIEQQQQNLRALQARMAELEAPKK